jgi:hypothetical protein
MTYYRIRTDQLQKDGSTVDEWQNVDIADGEPVPDGAIALLDDAADLAYRIVDAAPVLDWEPLHAELLAKIDRDAADFRRRFFSDLPGQGRIYQRKEVEARAFVAGSEGPFPMLEASRVNGQSLADAADVVILRATEDYVMEVLVEKVRIGAKATVVAAGTADEKRFAAEIDWELAVVEAGLDL